MKEKITNVIALIFVIFFFLFITVASIHLPDSDPDTVRQQIKDESMIF